MPTTVDRVYADWIKAFVPVNPIGLCAVVTTLMQETFPELTRVRGHYHCPSRGTRTHWWLVTKSGEIVDPTSAQFPSQGRGVYEPHDCTLDCRTAMRVEQL